MLSSAFTPTAATDPEPVLQPSLLPAMLQRSAAYSYNCCPADILHIIYEATQLSNRVGDDGAAAAAGILM